MSCRSILSLSVSFSFRSLNPDWTPDQRSTFVLSGDTNDILAEGLTFKVKDWDLIGGDDPLGKVHVEGFNFIEERGRREFKIEPPKGQEGADAGTLTIRWRKANRADQEAYKSKDKKLVFD